MAKRKNLTTKQQRFVDFYDGNALDACRKAGYTNPIEMSRKITQNSTIMSLIASREAKRKKSTIATREERQEFWTQVYRGELTQPVVVGMGEKQQVVEIPPSMRDRLKAAELLGKSEADFTDKHIIDGSLTLEERLKNIRE